jgi:hypothetical protein
VVKILRHKNGKDQGSGKINLKPFSSVANSPKMGENRLSSTASEKL